MIKNYQICKLTLLVQLKINLVAKVAKRVNNWIFSSFYLIAIVVIS